MRKLLPFIFATFVVGLFVIPAAAQKPTRVVFKRGAHSAIVSGTLSGYEGERKFAIRVKKGQRLTTEPVGDAHPVSIWITSPDGSSFGDDLDLSCHARRDVFPTAKGDYILTVQQCQKADPWKGRFRFRVTVK
jgi:hypothetical protein